VAADFFHKYDCTGIIKDIDFAVKARHGEYLLWAEAKKSSTDIIAMLAQLVLTIGKARTFNEVLPPKFLGCFDCEKIAFIPYADIQDIFHQNDFNWKVTPSNRETREFKMIYRQIDKIINNKTYSFDFEKDEKSLKLFILKNFMPDMNITKIKIDKNNFISVYAKWLETVKPTIEIDDWSAVKRSGVIDGDFYLADLLSSENKTLKEKLQVLLKSEYYELDRHKNERGLFISSTVRFNDKQKAHNAFWAIYERPPREAYWDYIIERRDLLVPQDVRERKGSFFTPKIWVELSQKYIADALGENWQEEYYVWDCAAGTGNLLAGLTNKYNVWTSTLDKADIDVMHDRIENGANLLKEHCFQFDFLNDDFDKLPEGLRKIINDPKKRKKLVVYINPPYAEAGTGLGKKHKEKIATTNATYGKYKIIGKARNELSAQFLARIYGEIVDCQLANFSKLAFLQAPNFSDFRNFFLAKLRKLFIVPADTFDNVNGLFPIGFFIWDTGKKEKFKEIAADVFGKDGEHLNEKRILCYDNEKGFINDWLRRYFDKSFTIGILHNNKNDFQHNNQVRITSDDIKDHTTIITPNNLIPVSIYFAVRHCIPADWQNDRDQFLYPNDGWKTDLEFQNNCLAYTLFHGQNNISCKYGTNHWIPFIEWDVSPRDRFDSHFMTNFINGKIKAGKGADLFGNFESCKSLNKYNRTFGEAFVDGRFCVFAVNPENPDSDNGCAAVVFATGRELWKYYHAQPKSNVNASLYDIREHFQGRNANGKMNSKSKDETYNELTGSLRTALKELAKKIEPKVYEYGFLKA
jgi:hypothetical protein